MTETTAAHALDLPILAKNALPQDLQDYLTKCEEKLGFIPNVLLAYAFDAVKLRAFIDMHDDLMLGESGVSKLEREMIAVVVSSVNHCYYCLTAHGATVRKRSGVPELGEQLVMNYRTAELSDKQRAMLDFSWSLTTRPAEIGEADRDALRDAGWSERDIWDISAVASFFNMSNRMATATDMRPNAEYQSMARDA